METVNDELLLLIRLLMASIFLSTAISKIKHFDDSILTIQDYKIIPNSFSKPFSVANILLEIVIGSLLLLGIIQKFTSVIGAILVLIYTIAITINLFKGRNDFSCGCGGVLESNTISWWLVIRNSIFILGLIYLSLNTSNFLSLENSFVMYYQDILSFYFLVNCFIVIALFNINETIRQNIKIIEHLRSFSK